MMLTTNEEDEKRRAVKKSWINCRAESPYIWIIVTSIVQLAFWRARSRRVRWSFRGGGEKGGKEKEHYTTGSGLRKIFHTFTLFETDTRSVSLLQSLIEQKLGSALLHSQGKIDSAVTPDLDPDAFGLSRSEVICAIVVGIVHVVVNGWGNHRMSNKG